VLNWDQRNFGVVTRKVFSLATSNGFMQVIADKEEAFLPSFQKARHHTIAGPKWV